MPVNNKAPFVNVTYPELMPIILVIIRMFERVYQSAPVPLNVVSTFIFVPFVMHLQFNEPTPGT